MNRFAYNCGLGQWKAEYKAGNKPSAMGLKKQFNGRIDAEFAFVRETCRDAYASAFFRLGDAFRRFFSGQNDYPRFKSRKRAKLSFDLANDKFACEGNWARLPKIGRVNMVEPLRFDGKVLKATVSFEAGHWWLSVTVEMPDDPLPPNERVVGVDLGVKTLAMPSDGERFENQEPLKSELAKLKRLNRHLARKQYNSGKWRKCRLKLQRLHMAIADHRQDAIHKMTTTLCYQYGTIVIEDLNASGMVRNRRLARSVSDAAFGEIGRQSEYKAEGFGRRLVVAHRFFPSSKTCSACGHVHAELTLADREWACPECRTHHDRDLNAAINLRMLGAVATS